VLVQKPNEKSAAELNKEDKEWKTEELFSIFDNCMSEEALTNLKIRGSMFPDDEKTMRDVYKIQNSMRVMPHDQNTGGFFIAVFRK
jgi:multisite-specific tRNA:(cytosine-C5)-methyltransferase